MFQDMVYLRKISLSNKKVYCAIWYSRNVYYVKLVDNFVHYIHTYFQTTYFTNCWEKSVKVSSYEKIHLFLLSIQSVLPLLHIHRALWPSQIQLGGLQNTLL